MNRFLATAAGLALCLGSVGCEPQVVGGKCTYRDIPGTVVILSAEKTTDPQKNADGIEVKYEFKPEKKLEEGPAANYLKQFPTETFELVDSSLPGPKYVEKYGLKKDAKFAGVLKEITTGTCTPIILEIKGVDRTDYFEKAKP